MRFLSPFILPGGLFFAVGVLFVIKPATLLPLSPYLGLLYPLIFLTGLVAGWRFKRTRLIFALVLCGLSLLLLQLHPALDTGLTLIATLLPFNLAVVMLLPEKGLASNWVALYGSLLLGQCLAAMWALTQPDLIALLDLPFPTWLPHAVQPPMSTVIACSLALGLALLLLRRRPYPLEAAFCWAILGSSLLLFSHSELRISTALLNLCGLILLAGLFESSHSMAYRDELTGIPGRRAFNEALGRLGSRYCLAMLDIDHFKKFNDRHGHDVGDQVLKMVAARLATVGGGGKAYRYGGEEFAILFAGKSLDEALPRLEFLRKNIAEAAFIPRSSQRPKKKPKQVNRKGTQRKALHVTISIGVAEAVRGKRDTEAILKAADKALYKAKEQGRNRVCS